jgi:hypothetical protein
MEELKRADPELYRDRVHWVDLRAGLVGDAARPAGAKGR